MQKRKILFIMPSMVGGGAERVLVNLFNLIDFNRYEITLFVAEHEGILWDTIPKEVKKGTLFPNPFISKVASHIFRRFGNSLLFSFYGKKIKGNYDVGISFLDSIYTEFLFYNQATIAKRVMVIHSSYKSYSNKSKFIHGRYKEHMKKRYGRLDKIVAVSKESLKEFKELFGIYPEMEVIYNPINNKDILQKASMPAPKELNKDVFHFVAIGSLLPVKGFDLLIDACFELRQIGLNFNLNILGSGPLEAELKEKVSAAGLNDYVFLRGFTSNPYTWLYNSDALIMSSVAEGLPTVLCEALVLGKPVITPNVPGCREVIEYGAYGLMCDREAKSMADAMAKLVTDPEAYALYRQKAAERSVLFDDQKALQEYYKIFEN